MNQCNTQLNDFAEIKRMIDESKHRAVAAVDSVTIDLYWKTGAFISSKIQSSAWGDAVVKNLAAWLAKEEPGLLGFSSSNLHRMVQFYETYSATAFLETVKKWSGTIKVAPPARLLHQTTKTNISLTEIEIIGQSSSHGEAQAFEIVAPLLRQISWSCHLLIMAGKRSPEERLFYLMSTQREHWGKRELLRQIRSSMYERTVSGEIQASDNIKSLPQKTEMVFRDSYSLELLGIPVFHNEKDLRKSIVSHLKEFFLEFGKDFCFIGEEYALQVGMKDFYVDLLFYHRELRCLIAVELKSREFLPKDLGQLEFYLEALDRQVKKDWENPSIGILLCQEKDDAVVEYSLSRSASPTMIAEYSRILPQKEMVKARLQELLEQAESLLEEEK